MTTSAPPPVQQRRLITPFRVLVTLILIGLLLWNLGVFKRAPRVAIITSGEGPYWDRVEAGARRAAENYDVNLTVIRCKTDMAVQNTAINQVIADKYDAVAISPINPVGEASALANIAASTLLVTMDSDSPVARRVCFVGTDSYDAGRLCGQVVHNAVPSGDVILFLGNPDKENTQRRRQGVIDELLQRSFDPERATDPMEGAIKGDNSPYTVVATIVDNADPAITTDLATKALKDHPNVKCLVGLLSYSAPALVKAVEKGSDVKVVGFDTSDATLSGIENGTIAGTVMQDQDGLGYQTVRVLSDIARGDNGILPVFAKRTLNCKIVNSDNLAAIRQELSGGAAAPAPAGPATAPSTQP